METATLEQVRQSLERLLRGQRRNMLVVSREALDAIGGE